MQNKVLSFKNCSFKLPKHLTNQTLPLWEVELITVSFEVELIGKDIMILVYICFPIYERENKFGGGSISSLKTLHTIIKVKVQLSKGYLSSLI